MGWGWGWGGDAITFLEVAHMLYATPRQRWCVNFRLFLCNHGTLLVCSCVHMVRCWCVMCRLGWGWGGDAITFLEVAHMLYANYATATLVCELSVF